MLDGFALRVEHAGLQVYINFGFHWLPATQRSTKHCFRSTCWIISPARGPVAPGSNPFLQEKLIMQNPPPVQTAPAPPVQGAPGKSSTGLDENVAALLSYIFGWVSGLIFFLIEKDSRLVRFHAMQSLLLNVLAAIIGIVIWVITVVLVLVGSQVSGI